MNCLTNTAIGKKQKYHPSSLSWIILRPRLWYCHCGCCEVAALNNKILPVLIIERNDMSSILPCVPLSQGPCRSNRFFIAWELCTDPFCDFGKKYLAFIIWLFCPPLHSAAEPVPSRSHLFEITLKLNRQANCSSQCCGIQWHHARSTFGNSLPQPVVSATAR